MHFHIITTIKFTSALWANVRFLTVHVAMCGQMTRLRKSSVTCLALVLAQTFVLEQVLVKKGFRRVTFFTDVTDKRFRVRVLHHMCLELGHDFEGFTTNPTNVSGGMTCLDVLIQHRQTGVQVVAKAAAEVTAFLHVHAGDMTKKSRAIWKYLAAVFAGEILRWQVRFHVNLQWYFMMIALSTIIAAVRSYALVNIIVFSQIKLRLETFRTLRTLYRSRIGMWATDMFHHVWFTDEFSVTDDTCVLLDTEVRFHVHRALIPTFVEFATELAGVAVLAVVRYMLDVIVHFDLFTIQAKKFFGFLHGFCYLLQLRQVLQLRYRRTVILSCATENAVDDTVYFHCRTLRIL